MFLEDAKGYEYFLVEPFMEGKISSKNENLHVVGLI
jgi:hypothetical protein